jgi:hypothetical protein
MLESTSLKEISLPIEVPVTGPPRQRTETPQGAFIMSLLRNERCDFYRGMATEIEALLRKGPCTTRCNRALQKDVFILLLVLLGCKCGLVPPAPRQPRTRHHSRRGYRFRRVQPLQTKW